MTSSKVTVYLRLLSSEPTLKRALHNRMWSETQKLDNMASELRRLGVEVDPSALSKAYNEHKRRE